MALSHISRIRAAEIQNGLDGDAGDVAAEFDQLVSAHNDLVDQSNANESDLGDTNTDLATLRSDFDTLETNHGATLTDHETRIGQAETDIEALEAASLGRLRVNEVTVSANVILDDEYDVYDLKLGSTVYDVLPPTTYEAGQRWFVRAEGNGSVDILTRPSGGGATSTIAQINGGECALIVATSATTVTLLGKYRADTDDDGPVRSAVIASGSFTLTKDRRVYFVQMTANVTIAFPPGGHEGDVYELFITGDGSRVCTVGSKDFTPSIASTIGATFMRIHSSWRCIKESEVTA